MNSTVFFKTHGAIYMYDSQQQSFTIVHPLVLQYYKLDQQGQLPLDPSFLLKEDYFFLGFDEQEKKYYYDKYIHFKNAGYFVFKEKTTKLKYSIQDIESAFYNADNIVFEVTDSCNLKCKYCGYGDIYGDHDARNNQYMCFDTIRCFIDYLCEY